MSAQTLLGQTGSGVLFVQCRYLQHRYIFENLKTYTVLGVGTGNFCKSRSPLYLQQFPKMEKKINSRLTQNP